MLFRSDYCSDVMWFLIIALIITAGMLMKKGKRKQAGKFIIGGFLLFFLGYGVRVFATGKLYMIDKEHNIYLYFVLGKPTMSVKRSILLGNAEYKIDPPVGQIMVLNCSGIPYHISQVIYGTIDTDWQDVTIDGNSSQIINISQIDYFPGQIPEHWTSFGAHVYYKLSQD